jgi:acyl-CoA hydrolase
VTVTPTEQKVRDKTITAKQWAEMVKSGDWIFIGSVGGDPRECVAALAPKLGDGPGQVKDIEIWNIARVCPSETHAADPEEKYHVMHEDFYITGRKYRDKDGTVDWFPHNWSLDSWYTYWRFANEDKAKRGMDWWVISTSLPDEHGYFNFSYGTNVCELAKGMSKKIVVEAREDYAWAEGGQNNVIHIDDVDYVVDVDCEKFRWPQMPEAEPGPIEEKIAEHVLTIMENGDCVQLGIGALPTAVARAIAKAGLRHLGVHTEMIQEGLITLYDAGCVDNSLKTLDRGKSVWTFAFPFNWKRYYDFVHRNPSLAVYDIDYTNNIYMLSRVDHLIGINNCVAVDFLGQICSGCYAGRPISGTGGHFHFIWGCALSRGGRGVDVMSARSKEGSSRIVPQLPPGSTADVPATLADWVCTEYGMVKLWGLKSYERAKALISIAHPDDREWLEKEAYKLGFVPKKFPVPMWPAEKRRYPSWKERTNYKIPYTGRIWGWDNTNDFISGK